MFQLQRGNLLSVMDLCLQEHQVNLSISDKVLPFYLIEGNAPSSVFEDFTDTYPEVDRFRRDLAKKVLGVNVFPQTYGVLVNTDLQYSYAFNRRFADLNPEKSQIVFKTPEDILLEEAKGKDLSTSIIDDKDGNSFPKGLSNMVIRYAIVGQKGQGQGNLVEPPQARTSMLDRIQKDYEKKEIKLSGQTRRERFFLVQVPYETSKLQDFELTYINDFNQFQQKLAKRLFGEGRQENNYSVIFNKDLRMVAAFNTAFAHYDSKRKEIVYTAVEDVLLNVASNSDLSTMVSQRPKTIFTRPNRGPVRYRYAIVGKE
jgi:hypothetical protein